MGSLKKAVVDELATRGLHLQREEEDRQEIQCTSDSWTQRNYSSVADLTDKVLDVLSDQSERGHVLRLTELEARRRYPDLVAAPIGALWNDKPAGGGGGGGGGGPVVTDPTGSLSTEGAGSETKRAPVEADLKGVMLEMARIG